MQINEKSSPPLQTSLGLISGKEERSLHPLPLRVSLLLVDWKTPPQLFLLLGCDDELADSERTNMFIFLRVIIYMNVFIRMNI